MFTKHTVRYDWLIDGEPTSLSYTEAGDVTRCVEVRMEFKTAGSAFENMPVAVLSFGVPTLRACLARESRIDEKHSLTDRFGIVCDKLPELSECPITEGSVESQAETFVPLDAQLLQRYRIERLGNNPFRYLVVRIGHETSLFARKLFELALGRGSAFGLKRPAIMLVSPFNRSNVRRGIKQVIGKNRMVQDAGIDAENSFWSCDWRVLGLDDDAQDEPVAIEGEPCSNRFPLDVPQITWRYGDLEMDTPLNARQGHGTLGELGGESPLVISYCGPFPLDWKPSLEFGGFEHFRSHITSGCDERRWDARIFLSNGVICKMVEFEFIENALMCSDMGNIISCHIDCLDGADETVVSRNVESYGALHITSLSHGVYILSAEIAESIPLQFLPTVNSGVSLGVVL